MGVMNRENNTVGIILTYVIGEIKAQLVLVVYWVDKAVLKLIK
jgi:hypothetical protein